MKKVGNREQITKPLGEQTSFFIAQNKQNLNLTSRAWRTIETDMVEFMGYREATLSGFLNIIITHYYEHSRFSITKQLSDESERIEYALGDDFEDLARIKFAFLNYTKESLIETVSRLPLGEARKFRISNDNVDLLSHHVDDESRVYGNNLGRFLKALFEDYAALNHSQREAVFYADFIEIFNRACAEEECLAIKLKSGEHLVLKPYRSGPDKLGLHHYFIGYKRDENLGNPPLALPFQEVVSMRPLVSYSGRLSSEEKNHLQKLLLAQSPRYFNQPLSLIRVSFTEEGLRQYEYRLENRPAFKAEMEDGSLVFESSLEQAYDYFCAFGANVEIITPDELKKSVLLFHRRVKK